VANGELVGTKLAFEANRPLDGIARAEWVFRAAGRDTFLMREAELRIVDGLQYLHRYDEAIERMRGMLERYPPIPPRRIEEEDPILKMPELMVALQRQLGDSLGARAEIRRALEYYDGLRAKRPAPLLEAQVLAREVRAYLELNDRPGALRALGRMEALATANPGLEESRAEILFSRGQVEGMRGGDYRAALATFDQVGKAYPQSPFAPRALLEAAILLEGTGNRRDALGRYRQVLDRFASNEEVAPIALFRQAMLRDQTGDWAGAKQDLERLPVRYPRSRAALEAPFAIIQHYGRAGDAPAMKVSLLRAIETYKGLVAADSLSESAVFARWHIARCYAGLDRWDESLGQIDEIIVKHRGHPITANAIVEAARISEGLGQKERARKYLQRFLADYPQSPLAPQVKARLEVTSRR